MRRPESSCKQLVLSLIASLNYSTVNLHLFLLFCQDECSFVSLRDVDRTLQVMMWFYHHGDLFNLIDEKAASNLESDKAASNLESEEVEIPRVRVII